MGLGASSVLHVVASDETPAFIFLTLDQNVAQIDVHFDHSGQSTIDPATSEVEIPEEHHLGSLIDLNPIW